ncbi:hypothetical protein [Sporosarcina sp. BP05]|uniref:hypothetical protein n=1 Tax=Sporosarcina sp. BP05 TaxID=2758726 RepID=UPI0016445ADB|nr:hypothetical protein [Sporosarcina sp. BP05]
MTILKSSEHINVNQENEKINLDRYNFVTSSPLVTKEISVVVDFLTDEITGDTIAYGSWYDIEADECIELLEKLEPWEIKRDFTSILEKYK